MTGLIRAELMKVFKLKQIYLGIMGAVFFSLIIFVNYLGDGDISAFMLPIATLGNLTQTFMIVIFLGITSYIYGVEVQEKTLKILYSKVVPGWRLVLAKFFIGIIYTFVLLYVVGAVILLISIMFYPCVDWLEFEGNHIIPAAQGFKYIFLSYTFQGICLIFISSLAITLAIIFDSAVISLILSFCLMLFSFIASNVDFFRPVLPTSYWLVWQDIIKKEILWGNVWKSTGILIFYSILLYIIAVYFYCNKEVNI